jgi:hypothetical protein
VLGAELKLEGNEHTLEEKIYEALLILGPLDITLDKFLHRKKILR